MNSSVNESAMTEEEKKRFISMEKDIHFIKNGLEEISTALLGSKLTKDGGLVKRIEELEQKAENLETEIEEHKKQTAKMEIYQRIMWLCAGGVVMAIFNYVLQFVFKK